MVGNASGIDLNNATVNELGRIGGLGPVLAARIVEQRPFRRWDELESIEGFDHELVNDLRGSGAKLGRPKITAESKPYSRALRKPKPPRKRSARPGVETKRSKNIFSGQGRD